jgi:hypothetical protein
MKGQLASMLILALAGVSISGAAFSKASSEPVALQTAIVDAVAFGGHKSDRAFAEVPETGATFVRLILDWPVIAPEARPPAFRASDPEDAAYDWRSFDEQVRRAAAHGLQPIIDIVDAPKWAGPRRGRGGPYKPDPVALAQFARAAATRYSGSVEGLPRARYWQLWNEPNLAVNLRPQLVGATVYSAGWYRRMLNSFADAIHRVRPDNVVVAGGTAPFTSRFGEQSLWGPGPLLFLRKLLCLSKRLEPTCAERARFDVWAHHPYTSGGPSHRANIPDDVSLGDLPRMKAVLDAGVATGHIVSRRKLGFWVTEFSWDTNPPDPNALPIALQTRWVSEALYTMWKAGVSLVTWYSLEDQPVATGPYQSGLFFSNGKTKPSLRAFRFPFVAFSNVAGIDVWGRTPSSQPGAVVVEQRSGTGWRRLGRLTTNAFGLFSARYVSKGKGALRARLVGSKGEVSQAFSLKRPPDRFVRPFGEPK